MTRSNGKEAGSTSTSAPDGTTTAGKVAGNGRPDQDAALRRLRAAFGYVQIVKIIDHDQTSPVPDEEPPEPER
jgi:hypothetical protein